jgi:hypothetical protein
MTSGMPLRRLRRADLIEPIDAAGFCWLMQTCPGALQMPADERISQQFALEDDAELKRQIDVEDRNVERRGVRDGIDLGLGVVERAVVRSGDFYRGENRLHDQPRPEAGEVVLDASVTIDERAE